VDLGVGDAGVVVEDGVHERGAELGSVVPVPAGFAGVGHGGAVLLALDAADVTPPATVADVAQFLDIDMDQRAWLIVLVAADRLAADPVQMGQPVKWQRTSTACTVEAGRPSC
jgi:hypothetical protein